jgi:hypothetical protein
LTAPRPPLSQEANRNATAVLLDVTFASDGLKLSGALHVPDDLRPGEPPSS